MLLESKVYNKEVTTQDIKTVNSYVTRDNDFGISYTAKFKGCQHRSKVEFLRFFIV